MLERVTLSLHIAYAHLLYPSSVWFNPI